MTSENDSDALLAALAQLAVAVEIVDYDRAPSLIRQCLGWLYNLEEQGKAHLGDAFHAHRAALPHGAVFAALTWFRGKAVHHQWPVAEQNIYVPMKYAAVDGLEQVLHTQDGQPFELHKGLRLWPERLALAPDKYGRDALYDQHVRLRPILAPLREAVTAAVAYESAPGGPSAVTHVLQPRTLDREQGA